MDCHDAVQLLGICGSLRNASYNRALLRASNDLAPAGVHVTTFDLAAVPPYDGDVEARSDPSRVSELKRSIQQSHGLLIATPECNNGVSGVLKNAIDWASRPPVGSVLSGKPVAIMGASTGRGGTRKAQDQLRQALAFSRADIVTGANVAVAEAYAKFDEHGRLMDETSIRDLTALLEALVKTIALHVHACKAA